jgi:Prokaryotic E2 family E
MALRRDFELLLADHQFLENYGLPWEAIQDGSPWVLMHEFPTHPGYNHKTVATAVRLETGYPLTQLDMVYFYPALVRIDGKPIGATSENQIIAGRSYQRWSRHRTAQNPWKPGEDDLGSHVALIEDWLAREFGE